MPAPLPTIPGSESDPGPLLGTAAAVGAAAGLPGACGVSFPFPPPEYPRTDAGRAPCQADTTVGLKPPEAARLGSSLLTMGLEDATSPSWP